MTTIEQENQEEKEVKIPHLSPESVTIAFTIILSFQENSQLLFQFLQSILKLQDPKDSAKILETAIKQQILPATQLTCSLPLADKLLLEEFSARSAIAFIYIIMRLIYPKMLMRELKQGDFKDLWVKLWEIGQMFPIIRKEWENAEKINNLRGWQEEMQEYAGDKWKYFNNKQLPLANERIVRLNSKMQSLLSLSSE